MWVYSEESNNIVKRPVTFVPGLYKIFDEIIVNAADNKQRDSNMSKLKVKLNNTISHNFSSFLFVVTRDAIQAKYLEVYANL